MSALGEAGNEEDITLIDALVAQGKLLAEQDYSFWAPTPETQENVICRLFDERSKDTASTSLSPEEKMQSLQASSLRDVFGWSMPVEPKSPLLQDLHPSFKERCVMESEGKLKSTIRYSSLYPSGGYSPSSSSSSSSHSPLYAHSSWPTKNDKDAIFFGPDTYRFLRYLTNSFARFTAGRTFGLGVDVGCGAGAGAIHLVAKDSNVSCGSVVGLDINPRALLFAKANAKLYSPDAKQSESKTESKLDWRLSNLLSALSESEKEQLDLVISNPPYIAFELSAGGGSTYADGGDQKGLALPIQIAREAIMHLKADGIVILYTGVPISLDGRDPLRTTLLEDAFFKEKSEMLDYEVLDVDAWGDELRDAQGSYGRSDVGQIAIVGTVLRRR